MIRHIQCHSPDDLYAVNGIMEHSDPIRDITYMAHYEVLLEYSQRQAIPSYLKAQLKEWIYKSALDYNQVVYDIVMATKNKGDIANLARGILVSVLSR